ncbi:MAG: hypothetical protein ACFCBU_02805 [Cyanophyceae cyanobacterium]
MTNRNRGLLERTGVERSLKSPSWHPSHPWGQKSLSYVPENTDKF